MLPALALLGAAPERADLILRGGTIYTGDAAAFVGDVAVVGDRIRYVGRSAPMPARRVIDARGMIVAPGFIDPHAHVGDMLASPEPRDRIILPFVMQGVTTAFIGNDGGGAPEIADTLAQRAGAVGINFASYVGFGAVRQRVVGAADRAPDAAEVARMKALVVGAMCQGALGLSSGLFYAPQSFARTDEVVALALVAARAGGRYDTHIRDESSYGIGLAAAVDEAIEIGRRARLPVNISHIKALGIDVQGQATAIIAKVEAARARGLHVTADQYPWDASGTSLVAALVPRWAQDGGRQALLARLADPALASRLRADITENLRRRGGAGALLITEGAAKGLRLSELARRHRGDAVAAAIAVIGIADPAVVSFSQSERDIAAFMARRWVMTGSDASPGHPRMYGSFARKYAEYVRKRRVLTLQHFVHRSATLTADTFGLADRGRLRRGAFADIVVFDPARYAAQADYAAPERLASGVRTVVVNGVLAVDGGSPTGAAAGRALRHRPREGACR